MWDKLELKLKTISAYKLYTGEGKTMLSSNNRDSDIMLILNDVKDEALLSEDMLNSLEGKKIKDIFNFVSINTDKIYITSFYKMQKDLINLNKNMQKELLDILISEIILVNPKFIISIGEEVFNLLVSDNLNLDINKKNVDIFKCVGNIYNYNNKVLIPIYDISYISSAKKNEKQKIIDALQIVISKDL